MIPIAPKLDMAPERSGVFGRRSPREVLCCKRRLGVDGAVMGMLADPIREVNGLEGTPASATVSSLGRVDEASLGILDVVIVGLVKVRVVPVRLVGLAGFGGFLTLTFRFRVSFLVSNTSPSPKSRSAAKSSSAGLGATFSFIFGGLGGENAVMEDPPWKSASKSSSRFSIWLIEVLSAVVSNGVFLGSSRSSLQSSINALTIRFPPSFLIVPPEKRAEAGTLVGIGMPALWARSMACCVENSPASDDTETWKSLSLSSMEKLPDLLEARVAVVVVDTARI